MELGSTTAAFAISAAVLGLALWHDYRPWRPGKANLVPVMIVALIGVLVFGAHLATLLLGD